MRKRIALVSPYSVSVPGGVQNQVLELARALRTIGHEVTVVAPVDGAPVDGVASVGRSLSISTNGSKAPIAPYPAAALRALRTLRHGAYDVVHLHEPFAPSITIPVLAFHRGPMVGTFHAAGDEERRTACSVARFGRWPVGSRFVLRCRRRQRHPPAAISAAATRFCSTASMLVGSRPRTPFEPIHRPCCSSVAKSPARASR